MFPVLELHDPNENPEYPLLEAVLNYTELLQIYVILVAQHLQ